MTLGEELLNKLGYKQFSLELTRRCNMDCIHCSRGNAQNVNMSEEVLYNALDNLQTIDEFVNDDKKYTHLLYFYGGEPFLCPESIHKCVKYITEKGIFLLGMWVITNGTVLSNEIASDFENIRTHIERCRKIFISKHRDGLEKVFKNETDKIFKDNPVSIQISYNYHNIAQSQKALEFYSKYNIDVRFFDKGNEESEKSKALSYSGRAKKLTDNKDIYFIVKDNHCMATGVNVRYVEKTICISANGNVFLGLDYEYTNIDNDNMGNVLNESIYDMAIKWNYKHPILYKEMKKYLNFKSIVFNYENGFISFQNIFPKMQSAINDEYIQETKNLILIYETLIKIRKEIHKKYDSLPIKDVVFQGDIAMEVESEGRYIETFYDEEDRKGWNFQKEKKALIEGLNSLSAYNEQFYYNDEKNKHLKPIHEKYPCLNRRDCIDLENAIRQYYNFSKSKIDGSEEIIHRHIDTIKKLKLKYWMFDMTMDDEIERIIKQDNLKTVKTATNILGKWFLNFLRK